jgi:hypothetical protein
VIAAHPTATWFETRSLAALLTMRVSDLILRSPPPAGVSKPHPEERRLRRVSKDEATALESALRGYALSCQP